MRRSGRRGSRFVCAFAGGGAELRQECLTNLQVGGHRRAAATFALALLLPPDVRLLGVGVLGVGRRARGRDRHADGGSFGRGDRPGVGGGAGIARGLRFRRVEGLELDFVIRAPRAQARRGVVESVCVVVVVGSFEACTLIGRRRSVGRAFVFGLEILTELGEREDLSIAVVIVGVWLIGSG